MRTAALQSRPERDASILFIVPQPFFQSRGSPIRVRFDVEALTELGYRVDLLTLPFGRNLQIPGLRIVRVPNLFLASDLRIGPSALKAAFDLVLLLKAVALIARNRYDVVHCIEDGCIAGLLLRRVVPCRLIYEKHSDPASYRGGPLRNLSLRLYAALEVKATRRADAVITGPSLVEQASAAAPNQSIHCIFSLPSSQVTPDPATVRKLRAGLLREGEDVLITYVGSFAVYQGLDLLFQSMPAVLGRNPSARFMVIGGTAAELARRQKALSATKIQNAVTLVGQIEPDRVPEYLEASDILVSPRTLGRNSPIKLLDYLRAGRPVVATNVSANRVYLDDSVAVLTEPSPSSLAAGLEKLIRDPGLRESLSRDSRRRIEASYTFEEFRRRLGACYAELLSRSPSGLGGDRPEPT